MSKVVFVLVLTAAISTTSFSQKQKGKFEITGKLSGFPDSTLIYLDNDSTFIINNQFHFNGSLKENVKHVCLGYTILATINFFGLKIQ